MTFEQAHPDVAKIIEERGYNTKVYERKVLGTLVEYWEKNENGVWQDKTESKLNEAKDKERLRLLYAALKKVDKELEEYE